MICFLGIGSNVGDRAKNLEDAISGISFLPDTRLGEISGFYETEPVGGPLQGNFLNAAIEIETSLDEEKLLYYCLEIEKRMGRKRSIKWGPRIIDIDILLYGNKIIDKDNLKIPHPLMHERAFVLVPLAEISPKTIHPVSGKTIIEILEDKGKKGIWSYKKRS